MAGATVIKLFGGDLGGETMLVRCNLSEASAPVQVDYCTERGEERWQPTQYQCADCRHYTSGLAEIGMILAAEAVGMGRDEFDCDWEEVEEVDPTLSEMAAVLTSHGEQYTGNNVMDEAADWIDHGFSAEDAGEWMDAGFWDAGAANTVRAMGLTPQQAAERAEALADAEEDAAEVYTDGDVIYSICNGDTDASVLADE